MSKIGLTVLKSEAESPLSPHFGMAGWILIYDTETQQKIFERNRLLYGRGVVETLRRHRCADAIFASIGPGVLEALKAAGIRGWCAKEGVPVPKLIEQFREGKLMPAEEAQSHGPERHHGRKGRSNSTNCCGEQEIRSPGQTRKEPSRRRRCCAGRAA